MSRVADRVHTDQAVIDRLQALVPQLPNDARVLISLEDGEQVAGIVAARPVLQLFFDPKGNEGMNGLVRIEDPALVNPEGAGWRDIWLDRISDVVRQVSGSAKNYAAKG